MKKLIYNFLCLSLILGFIVIIPFLSTDTKILSLEEQQKLKEGKTFWHWQSPYGSLAMRYIEKGSGPKHVILLHGFRANTFTWRHLINPLAASGYHVWAIDLVGYGLSDKPIHAPYDLDFFLEQVYCFMEANQISDAHLVGNSMGGGITLGMAIFHPTSVRSLSLISALGYPLDLNFYLLVGKNFGRLLAPFHRPIVIRKGMEDIVYRKEAITDDQIDAYSLPYRLPGGTIASTLTFEHYDNQKLSALSNRYKEITQPILVLWGDQDKLIPVNHYYRFINDFPACEKILIKDCGHIPQEEAADEVTASLIQFFNRQDN